MTRMVTVLTVMTLLAILPGPIQAQAPRAIRVVMTSYKFEPNRIELTAGEHVVLQLVNEDQEQRNHNLETALFVQSSLTVRGDVFADKDKGDVRFIAVAPGGVAEVEFTVPDAGQYSFVCSIPGHTRRGMTGAFTVAPKP